MSEYFESGKLPILALRGLVVFPEQTVHFDIGRVKSALALEEAMKRDNLLILAPQKDLLDEDPGMKDLYPVATLARVKQILKSHGENIRVLVAGVCRVRITELTQSAPYLTGVYERINEAEYPDTMRLRAMRREANSLYGSYLELMEPPAQAVQLRMIASEDCGFIADSIAQNSGIEYPNKAKLLCQTNPVRRLENAIVMLRQEVTMLQLESDIQE